MQQAPEQEPELTPEEMKGLAGEYIDVKARIADAQLLLDELAADLIEQLRLKGEKTISVNGVKVSMIEATRVLIDEPRLKKAIGAKLWDSVQKKVLDRDKLETKVAAGDIDVNLVAGCSEIVPNRAYLKVNVPKTAAPAGGAIREAVRINQLGDMPGAASNIPPLPELKRRKK